MYVAMCICCHMHMICTYGILVYYICASERTPIPRTYSHLCSANHNEKIEMMNVMFYSLIKKFSFLFFIFLCFMIVNTYIWLCVCGCGCVFKYKTEMQKFHSSLYMAFLSFC